MAGHACFGRRQAGKRGLLDRGVAVAAIQSQTRDMMLVAEGHLLLPRHVLVGGVRRAVNQIDKAAQAKKTKENGGQYYSGEAIAAFAKNLRHSISETNCPPVSYRVWPRFHGPGRSGNNGLPAVAANL